MGRYPIQQLHLDDNRLPLKIVDICSQHLAGLKRTGVPAQSKVNPKLYAWSRAEVNIQQVKRQEKVEVHDIVKYHHLLQSCYCKRFLANWGWAIVKCYHYHDSTGAYHGSENTITIIVNVINIMCTQVSYCNVYVIMQQIHLSTLEKIMYFNVQVSSQITMVK